MFDAAVAAAFEDIDEPDDVAIDVGVGILEGIANPAWAARWMTLSNFSSAKASPSWAVGLSILTKRKFGWGVSRLSRFS